MNQYCPKCLNLDPASDHSSFKLSTAYADGETGENYSQDTMMTTRLEPGDQEVPDISAMSGELYAADNLVAAPKMVDKAALQIG